MAATEDFYTESHLTVAAIRMLTHQHTAPPSIDAVCEALSYSLEQGHLVCRKLAEMGVIDILEGAYGTRLFIKNHLAVEEIPRGTKVSKLEEALKKFQTSKKDYDKKIESIQAEQAKRKKDLFADLENKLKKKMDKK
jgi:hypothetical protein